MASGDNLRIVLIGKTGVGKSAVGNTILGVGAREFDSRSAAGTVTTKCEMINCSRNKREISVVDTPGILDTTQTVDDVAGEIVKCIQFSCPGPHAFLLVMQIGRFTKEEKNCVEALQKLFGEGADKYMMVLFTRGDDIEKGRNIEQYVREAGAELQHLIQRCGGRFHVFNNKSKDKKQVDELIKKIDIMNVGNGGGNYTDEMYEVAAAIRQAEERGENVREKVSEFLKTMKQRVGKFILMLIKLI